MFIHLNRLTVDGFLRYRNRNENEQMMSEAPA